MAQGWNHRIAVRGLAGVGVGDALRCSHARCRSWGARGWPEIAPYVSAYDYVTGRAGRVATARRPLCPRHAAAFAKAHGLALPPLPDAQAAALRT